MKKVFTHENRLIAFHIKNLLQGQGIDCLVKNEFASGGVGDLSPFETWPEIWVEDKHSSRAEQIVNQHALSDTDELEWTCTDCGEKNESTFKICWNCNRSKSS